MKNLLVFAGLSLSLIFALDANGQNRSSLFILKENPSAKADKYSIASVRESEIEFTRQNAPEISKISFPLFDGKIYDAKRVSTEIRALDDYTWRGNIIEKDFSGDVILTFRKGFVSGLIYAPNAVYEIVPKGDKQILIELNQTLFPDCGGEIKGEETKANSSNLASVDSGDRIDVLVVYTTATKNFLGGDAQAQTLAQQAIDATNTAYINSKIRQRVRMVHAQEYLYTETTSGSTDLSNLRSNVDIQNLRNTHRADLVSMIGEIQGACGVGYLMGADSPNSQNNGFTVTARSCAVGNLSFAHELGHNMGSAHNPENGSSSTYSFGFGHYVNGNYRTVMSYVDPCANGCTRRPYFSNPNVVFNGFPTGIDNARDNARSINLTADSIANYRYSGANLMLNNFNGGDVLPRNIARNLTWSSENITGNVRIEISRDESTNWETLIASTPNDGAENITIYGRPTRRARVRVVSIDNPIYSDSSVRNVTIR
ncbi:MAG TPA: M12 family metallo-peptidase [Pyrinomonadaceae bacterium]|nr:M12 family metallo-peptidase [Pyrinomonadaceae bacterium]